MKIILNAHCNKCGSVYKIKVTEENKQSIIHTYNLEELIESGCKKIEINQQFGYCNKCKED